MIFLGPMSSYLAPICRHSIRAASGGNWNRFREDGRAVGAIRPIIVGRNMVIAGTIISASLVRCLFVLPNAKTDSPRNVAICEPQRATIQRLADEELKTSP